MTDDFPTSWSDEPWPLEEPEHVTFRPRSWSDSIEDVPQPADLADEAQALADKHGWPLGRALAVAQGREAPELAHAAMKAQLHAYHEAATSRVRAAVAEFEEGLRRVGEAIERVDWSELRAKLEEFAADANEAAAKTPPPCPLHGPVTKGGFCRRCGR